MKLLSLLCKIALSLALTLCAGARCIAMPLIQQTLSTQDLPADSTPAVTADTLVMQNRRIAVMRATMMGYAPQQRVQNSLQRIDAVLAAGVKDSARAKEIPQGMLISIGKQAVFVIAHEDLDVTVGETLADVGQRTVENLTLALQAEWQQRNTSYMLTAVALALLATIFFALLLRGLLRGHSYLSARLRQAAQARIFKIGLEKLSEAGVQQSLTMLQRLLDLVAWGAGLFLTYSWIVYSLRRFPQTRPLGDAMRGLLVGLLGKFTLSIVAAIPALVTVFLIFIFTRFLIRLVKVFFAPIESGRIAVPWIHPETASPTRRIIITLLWLFALIAAYPYLPGSGSDAFKGISVFAGLMLSLGSSGVVNQAMSGLMLMYSRSFRIGDYVRIGEIEGVVTALSILSAKIATNKREEITIPNNVITSTTVKNFSRLAKGEGIVLYTSVTIGYATPWRQVQALLLMAADRTAGLKKSPLPFVLQTVLADFYVEYQLNAYLDQPSLRLPTLSLLHASIQDVFNEFGVQIMSPHYEADPAAPVWVPPEKWHEPPAPQAVPREAAGSESPHAQFAKRESMST